MTELVRVAELPPDAAELSGLDRYDYAEAFAFETTTNRTPEQWSRRILQGASRQDRLTMLATWTALTVRLSPPWTAQVLGWKIHHSSPDALVLGVHAMIGLTARVVVLPDNRTVVHSMLVRFERPVARRVWTRLAPAHRKFLARIIDRAAR